MGWAFSPAMDYAYAGRWTGALTPRVFSGPLLDSLQWDDTTWSQCLVRHRRDARPATLLLPGAIEKVAHCNETTADSGRPPRCPFAALSLSSAPDRSLCRRNAPAPSSAL